MDGEFKPGAFLPGERLLSERFSVSYMTARRAIETLVAEGLCERRGKRTVVSLDALRLAGSVRFNLLCAHLNTFCGPLLKVADKMARAHGWITQLMVLHGANDQIALRALASGDPCLLLIPEDAWLQGKIGQALSAPHGPVVIVGNCPHKESVPWIKADDHMAMRLAISHLRELGHRSILFVYDDIKHRGIADCLDEWARYARKLDPGHLQEPLCVSVEGTEPRPHLARQKIKHHLEVHPHPTAIICDNDELALGVIYGLRDIGIEVPKNISIVCFGDTVLAEYCVPSLSVVDLRFERHMRIATNLILDALSGREIGGEGHLIQPHFIQRESSATPPHGRSRR